jgi:hypothetical protein
MLVKKHQRCQESFSITLKKKEKKDRSVLKFEYSNEKETKKEKTILKERIEIRRQPSEVN